LGHRHLGGVPRSSAFIRVSVFSSFPAPIPLLFQ
jgi:hypothetical protein